MTTRFALDNYERIEIGADKNMLDGQNIVRLLKDIMCTQMPERVGIKKHGEIAIAAMVKELRQLNEGAVA